MEWWQTLTLWLLVVAQIINILANLSRIHRGVTSEKVTPVICAVGSLLALLTMLVLLTILL